MLAPYCVLTDMWRDCASWVRPQVGLTSTRCGIPSEDGIKGVGGSLVGLASLGWVGLRVSSWVCRITPEI